MLRGSDALEVTFHHNTQPWGKSLGLLHRVSCKDNCSIFLFSGYSWDNFPHEPSCLWIHSCRRLIQEDDARVANHGHGYWQFSFISTWKSTWEFVFIFCKVHLTYFSRDCCIFLLSSKWFHVIKQFQLLSNSQIFNQCIKLWTIAKWLSNLVEVLAYLQAIEVTLSRSGSDFTSQHFESCAFSSPIYS